MMHESKGQHIGKAPSLHLFHSTVRQCMGVESAPIHVVINAVHKYFEFYTLITMTSLQPTQAQGL